MGAMLLVPLYFQLARDDSALLAGLLLAPQGLDAAIGYRGLDAASIPRATSALRIVQQLGASLGVALLALALQTGLTDAAGGAADIANAFGHTFWWAFGLTACATVPAVVLMWRTGTRLGKHGDRRATPI